MKERVGKRGLSPVVASSLMILLVIVLASIVFLWTRGFISERIEKFGEPIDNYCERVVIEVSRDGSRLDVLNSGDVDLRHLDIELSSGGTSEIQKYSVPIPAGTSATEYVTFELSDGTPADKVTIYPALIGEAGGDKRVFTCLNRGVVL